LNVSLSVLLVVQMSEDELEPNHFFDMFSSGIRWNGSPMIRDDPFPWNLEAGIGSPHLHAIHPQSHVLRFASEFDEWGCDL